MPGRTRKTTNAVRSARSFAPSPRLRMKNDSIPPGIRPTTKSTATSGRNTPSPNTRKTNVPRRPAPPASAPAANRYHGSRRMNAQGPVRPSATPGERRGVPMNLCPKSRPTTNSLSSPWFVLCGREVFFHAREFGSARGKTDCPDGPLDDPPHRGTYDRDPRARAECSDGHSERLRGGGGWGVRSVHRGRVGLAWALGHRREQSESEARGRHHLGGGPRPERDDPTREHALHAEMSPARRTGSRKRKSDSPLPRRSAGVGPETATADSIWSPCVHASS